MRNSNDNIDPKNIGREADRNNTLISQIFTTIRSGIKGVVCVFIITLIILPLSPEGVGLTALDAICNLIIKLTIILMDPLAKVIIAFLS